MEHEFVDGDRPRPPSWERLQEHIHSWLVVRFGLNRPLDKDIWLFCIGAAMELERMAIGVLWVADGRAQKLYEYERRMTLGQASQQIARRKLLDGATTTILDAVAKLRNSVAHRDAIFVTVHSPIQGHEVGEYKGYHVFIHEQALDALIRDVDTATQAMWEWIARNAPDLAEQARRGE